MTFTFQTIGVPVAEGHYIGTGQHSFGVPVSGVREHPVEMSATVVLPRIPITILNDAILVTESGPLTEDLPA